MKKAFKSIVIASVLGWSGLGAAPVLAEVTANAAVVSNYVFRGFTQTDDGPAVQGGIDYTHDSGFYLGAWASNVEEGFEIDGYLGFAGEVNGFGYDVGFITYEYTDDQFFDGAFREAYVGGSYGPASLTYYSGTDTSSDDNYSYVDLGLDFKLPAEVALALHYGVLSPDVAGAEDTADYSLSVGKTFAGFDVSVNYATNDDDEEETVFLAVSTEFDL